jgi:hypothetical protein
LLPSHAAELSGGELWLLDESRGCRRRQQAAWPKRQQAASLQIGPGEN